MIKNKITYSEAVKKAEEAVKDISDVKIKLVAFETILKDILSTEESSDNIKEVPTITRVPVKQVISKSGSKLIDKFISSTGLESKQLELIYSINEDKKLVRIVSDFQHNIGKWSQINFVLLRLFANYIVTENRKSLSLPIIREMKDYGYGGLPNINPFMKTISPLIVHVVTKKKKSENTFELTEMGIDTVKKLINEIVNNNGIVPLQPLYLPNRISKSKPQSKLAIHIVDQITDGFFDKPKTIQEIKQKLTEKGHFYERNIVDEKIRRRFLNKELKRLRIDKKWHYVKK